MAGSSGSEQPVSKKRNVQNSTPTIDSTCITSSAAVATSSATDAATAAAVESIICLNRTTTPAATNAPPPSPDGYRVQPSSFTIGGKNFIETPEAQTEEYGGGEFNNFLIDNNLLENNVRSKLKEIILMRRICPNIIMMTVWRNMSRYPHHI